ncbi:MAG: hypothetical protein Alpg2KO_29050 [Alphaproteobacteria bacterium]
MSSTVDNLARLTEGTGADLPGPLLLPEEYHSLLLRLVSEGEPAGKTRSVAGYLLRNLTFVTEDQPLRDNRVGVQPHYVVMDTDLWPNEYAQKLAMEEIFRQYAHQVIEADDINAPEFKGPGIWTAKRNAFEEDYKRSTEIGPDGKRVNIYHPDPLAHRLCLDMDSDQSFTMPTSWGSYPMQKGSTLTIRAKHLRALGQALRSIEVGLQTAEQALYTKDDKGRTVARFDIYGMDPGFRADNYDTVALDKSHLMDLYKLRDVLDLAANSKDAPTDRVGKNPPAP